MSVLCQKHRQTYLCLSMCQNLFSSNKFTNYGGCDGRVCLGFPLPMIALIKTNRLTLRSYMMYHTVRVCVCVCVKSRQYK